MSDRMSTKVLLVFGFLSAVSSILPARADAASDLYGQYFLAERMLDGEGSSWTRTYFRDAAAKMRKTLQEVQEKRLRADPTASEVHMMLGRLLMAAGDFSQAETEFSKATELTPKQLLGAGEFSPSDLAEYRRRLSRAAATAIALDGRFEEAKTLLQKVDSESKCGSDLTCWKDNLEGCYFGLRMMGSTGPRWDRSFFSYGPRDECTATWLIDLSDFFVTRSRFDLAEAFLRAADFALQNSRFTPDEKILELRFGAKVGLFDLLKRQQRLDEARELVEAALRDPKLSRVAPSLQSLLKTL